ncbi:acyltransferase family protein [Inquilinus limosus]|uniref:acyltransferase family protein n=1 Tax=Inquilinus limosus TaxID=171674 RepID=UPI000683FF62|nr:acyltransferase [Inquilinus limosus]
MQDADRSDASRIGCLDGLRGLASLWVLVGHGLLLSGWHVPIVASPDFGVDLFIMISGFLMAFHYMQRRQREPWEAPSTWITFWIRRFFRIAPLYYATLAVAVATGPWLGEARVEIASVVPASMTSMMRYTDQSLQNILLHLSFLFGLLPDYGFRTALPDWSIGLEMQYYLALPFLMLVISRIGWLAGAVAIAAAGILLFSISPSFFDSYEMPSVLVLKLHVFLAGMLCAGAMGRSRRAVLLCALLAVVLAAVPIGGRVTPLPLLARAMIALGLFGLIHHAALGGLVGRVLSRSAALLGSRPFHLLGEASYGLYLIHLLVMLPAVAYVATTLGTSTPAPARFAFAMALTVPIVFAATWLVYNTIEMPGRALGRRILASPVMRRSLVSPVR